MDKILNKKIFVLKSGNNFLTSTMVLSTTVAILKVLFSVTLLNKATAVLSTVVELPCLTRQLRS